jgi:repressor of nif and glnA expression
MTDSPGSKEVKITGSDLLARVKELLHQGNVRHILIKNESGKTLLEIPLTLGILGVALIPVYAAVAAIAALAVKCIIEVKSTEDTE